MFTVPSTDNIFTIKRGEYEYYHALSAAVTDAMKRKETITIMTPAGDSAFAAVRTIINGAKGKLVILNAERAREASTAGSSAARTMECITDGFPEHTPVLVATESESYARIDWESVEEFANSSTFGGVIVLRRY